MRIRAALVLGLIVTVLALWPVAHHAVFGPRSLASAAPTSSASVLIKTTLTIGDPWGGARVIKANNGSGVTITANEVTERGYQLNDSTVTVYDAAASGSWSDFDGMYFEADTTVDLELCCNDGASEALFVVRLLADQPFMLGSDVSFHTSVGGSMFAGTVDVIDLIRLIELNATNAHVRVVMWR